MLLQAIFKGLMNFGRAVSDWLILFWQVSSMQLWDDLMTLLIAGLETLAAVLTWTFYLLAQVFYISCKFCIIFLVSLWPCLQYSPWVHNCSQGLWHMNSVNFSTLILELCSYIHTGLGWFFCFCRTLLLQSAHLCCHMGIIAGIFILFFLNHIGKLHSTYVHPWACSKSSCFCTAIFVQGGRWIVG
jgi:hypothetical protein